MIMMIGEIRGYLNMKSHHNHNISVDVVIEIRRRYSAFNKLNRMKRNLKIFNIYQRQHTVENDKIF